MPRIRDEVTALYRVEGSGATCYFCGKPFDLLWVYTPRCSTMEQCKDMEKVRVRGCGSCASGLSVKQSRIDHELTLAEKVTLMSNVKYRGDHKFVFPGYEAFKDGTEAVVYFQDPVTLHIVPNDAMKRLEHYALKLRHLRNRHVELWQAVGEVTTDPILKAVVYRHFANY